MEHRKRRGLDREKRLGKCARHSINIMMKYYFIPCECVNYVCRSIPKSNDRLECIPNVSELFLPFFFALQVSAMKQIHDNDINWSHPWCYGMGAAHSSNLLFQSFTCIHFWSCFSFLFLIQLINLYLSEKINLRVGSFDLLSVLGLNYLQNAIILTHIQRVFKC